MKTRSVALALALFFSSPFVLANAYPSSDIKAHNQYGKLSELGARAQNGDAALSGGATALQHYIQRCMLMLDFILVDGTGAESYVPVLVRQRSTIARLEENSATPSFERGLLRVLRARIDLLNPAATVVSSSPASGVPDGFRFQLSPDWQKCFDRSGKLRAGCKFYAPPVPYRPGTGTALSKGLGKEIAEALHDRLRESEQRM